MGNLSCYGEIDKQGNLQMWDKEELVLTAKKIKGFRFIHLFCSCPPGHKSAEADSIKIARLATESCVFPLYEVKNGRFKFTLDPPRKPIDEYISLQRRFVHWTEEDIGDYQRQVDRRWRELKKLK